jgi:hypothetical protein
VSAQVIMRMSTSITVLSLWMSPSVGSIDERETNGSHEKKKKRRHLVERWNHVVPKRADKYECLSASAARIAWLHVDENIAGHVFGRTGTRPVVILSCALPLPVLARKTL